MLSPRDREKAGRSIRSHILNWQDRRGAGSTAAGALRELTAAVQELTLVVRQELPEEGVNGQADEDLHDQAAVAPP